MALRSLLLLVSLAFAFSAQAEMCATDGSSGSTSNSAPSGAPNRASSGSTKPNGQASGDAVCTPQAGAQDPQGAQPAQAAQGQEHGVSSKKPATRNAARNSQSQQEITPADGPANWEKISRQYQLQLSQEKLLQ